ncbi:fused MFS/spermidine synthase [soil metagenome]
MNSAHSRTLQVSGLVAEITPDSFGAAGFTLRVGGEAQSHVYLTDARTLLYDYVRRIANATDLLVGPNAPIRVLHLGAGALTLARYIGATRPGSEQFAIEFDPDLLDFVLESLPLEPATEVTVRIDDARRGLGWAQTYAPFDLVVADVYVGSSTPQHLTTTGFYREVAALLSRQGVLAVNVADDSGLAAVRAQAATMGEVFSVVAIAGPADLTGDRREGNAVILASPGQHMLAWLPRLAAAGPHPSGLIRPHELPAFIDGAAVVTDAASATSAQPRLRPRGAERPS